MNKNQLFDLVSLSHIDEKPHLLKNSRKESDDIYSLNIQRFAAE